MKEPNPGTVQLAKNVVLTLMLSQCQLSFWQLKQDMLVRFKQDVTLNMCRNELRDYVEVYHRDFLCRQMSNLICIQ